MRRGSPVGTTASASLPCAVKQALPDTPVLAYTGVTHETVREVLSVADGCLVGSSLKIAGDTWKAVDREWAADFMRIARGR